MEALVFIIIVYLLIIIGFYAVKSKISEDIKNQK